MRREVSLDYLKAGLEKPIPGESLTSDPEAPWPWERPPEFTSVHKACEYLFEQMTNEDNYMQLMTLAAEGVPLMNITRLLLQAGFQEGKWNPDMVMLLAEPVVYMMAALLERADIDFIIDYEEEDDVDAVDGDDFEALQQLQRKSKLVPEEIEQRLQEIEPPVIEEEKEEEVLQQPSLLGEPRT